MKKPNLIIIISLILTLSICSAANINFPSLTISAKSIEAIQSAPYSSSRPIPEPVLFGEGIISTRDMESTTTFSPDGRTIYYTIRNPSNFSVIVFSHFRQGKWSTPEIAEFSGQYTDTDPFISPDGSKLYFSSRRPIAGQQWQADKDFDLWFVERNGDHWSEPKSLGEVVNSKRQDYFPTVTSDGTLYFNSSRDGGKGKHDIYRAKLVDGKYQLPENLGDAINTEYTDYDPYISPDESFILFASVGRPDGFGDGDLYISYNENGVWTKAVNLGSKINSNALDFSPYISPDGKYLFFTSERGGFNGTPPPTPRFTFTQFQKSIQGSVNGLTNIYQVDSSVLKVNP